jgi:hypothetical protein
MAKMVLRQGDINLGGGILMALCVPNVVVNGRQIAVRGSLCTPHPGIPAPKIHPPNPLIAMATTVVAGGRAVGGSGDFELLLHPYIIGSTNVTVG